MRYQLNHQQSEIIQQRDEISRLSLKLAELESRLTTETANQTFTGDHWRAFKILLYLLLVDINFSCWGSGLFCSINILIVYDQTSKYKGFSMSSKPPTIPYHYIHLHLYIISLQVRFAPISPTLLMRAKL